MRVVRSKKDRLALLTILLTTIETYPFRPPPIPSTQSVPN